MHLATSSRQQWLVAEEEEEPFPTMVTNGDAGEVSKNNTKMAEVRKKKETVLGRREENAVRKKKPKHNTRDRVAGERESRVFLK